MMESGWQNSTCGLPAGYSGQIVSKSAGDHGDNGLPKGSMKSEHGPALAGSVPSSTSTLYMRVSPSSFGSRITIVTSSGTESPSSRKDTTAFGGSSAKLFSPSPHSLTNFLVCM